MGECPGRWASSQQPGPWGACRAGLGHYAVFVVGVVMPHSGVSAGKAWGQVLEHSDSPAPPGQRDSPSPATPRDRGVQILEAGHVVISLPMLRHPHGTRRGLASLGPQGDPFSEGVLASQGHTAYFAPGGTKLGGRGCWPPLLGFCPLSSGFPTLTQRLLAQGTCVMGIEVHREAGSGSHISSPLFCRPTLAA